MRIRGCLGCLGLGALVVIGGTVALVMLAPAAPPAAQGTPQAAPHSSLENPVRTRALAAVIACQGYLQRTPTLTGGAGATFPNPYDLSDGELERAVTVDGDVYRVLHVGFRGGRALRYDCAVRRVADGDWRLLTITTDRY